MRWLMIAALAACSTSHADPSPKDAPATTDAAAATTATTANHKVTRTGQVMGTNVQITFWTANDEAADAAFTAAMDELARIDKLMTTWTPDSEVSQINTAAGEKTAVKVSDETFTVIARAIEISKKSKGLFDITVGAFKGLWKFDEDMDGTLPDPKDVAERLKLVNYKDVVLDKKKKTVRLKKKGMSITLGGIAKGYAVDRAVDVLKKAGFTSFIVQVGGDLYVAGKKDTRPWIVGIRDPRSPKRDDMFASAAVEDHSFSTSGDYERGFVKDGKRYHHILDPRTGFPADKTRSVTVMAKDAFTADAWSKVLFIEGADQAMKEIVERLPDFEAVFVDANNQVHSSSGLTPGKQLDVLKQPTPGI
jgi:thiamine biosynthesis lipoprotein